MLRPLATRLLGRCRPRVVPPTSSVPHRALGTATGSPTGTGTDPSSMPYHHFTRYEKPKPKFRNPRKRASKLFAELSSELVERSRTANEAVLGVPFRVGDAIEIEMVNQGGIGSADLERIRGVVLGRVNRGLGSSVLLRDVVMGEPLERRVQLHSPLLRSLRVLESNFVHKGKKRVRRAKLYYLRNRKPEETRVTKW